jgi:hypothetical protein
VQEELIEQEPGDLGRELLVATAELGDRRRGEVSGVDRLRLSVSMGSR